MTAVQVTRPKCKHRWVAVPRDKQGWFICMGGRSPNCLRMADFVCADALDPNGRCYHARCGNHAPKATRP